MPVVRVSIAVISPIRRSSSGLRVAPRPTLCGNRVAPTTLLWPCIASMPQITGIALPPPEVSIDASQNASDRASHSAGVALYLPPGSELPPARIEPSRYLRTSSGVMLPMSPWISWPTFSSRVMLASSSSMRFSIAGSAATGQASSGHWSGWMAPSPVAAWVAASAAGASAGAGARLQAASTASASAAARVVRKRAAGAGAPAKMHMRGLPPIGGAPASPGALRQSRAQRLVRNGSAVNPKRPSARSAPPRRSGAAHRGGPGTDAQNAALAGDCHGWSGGNAPPAGHRATTATCCIAAAHLRRLEPLAARSLAPPKPRPGIARGQQMPTAQGFRLPKPRQPSL